MRGERVVFVDRDGVVNEDIIGGYITRWEDFKFHDTVLTGLKKLTQADYKIILISNQAGVGDGVYSEKALREIHSKMTKVFKKEGIQLHGAYFCLHGKQASCECRKPKTGLFEQAAKNGIVFDRKTTYFIGDKVTDIEAGKNFGLRTILVRTGYGRDAEAECSDTFRPDAVVDNFEEAADRVLCG